MREPNSFVYIVPAGMLLFTMVVSWSTYPCDAYGNIKWNMTAKSELRPKYLAKFRDPYRAKCTENCDSYKKKLDLVLRNVNFDDNNSKDGESYPNPFCYNWDLEYNDSEGSSIYYKLKNKIHRSIDGNWKNKMSISFSISTIILLSMQTAMNEDLSTTDIWFTACLFTTVVSHLGSLYFGRLTPISKSFGIAAFSYLTCQERVALHDPSNGKFKGFSFLYFCDQTKSGAQQAMYDGKSKLFEVQLPEMPLEWTIYKWNLVFKYITTVPLVAAGICNTLVTESIPNAAQAIDQPISTHK